MSKSNELPKSYPKSVKEELEAGDTTADKYLRTRDMAQILTTDLADVLQTLMEKRNPDPTKQEKIEITRLRNLVARSIVIRHQDGTPCEVNYLPSDWEKIPRLKTQGVKDEALFPLLTQLGLSSNVQKNYKLLIIEAMCILYVKQQKEKLK